MSMQNFWGVKEVHYGIVQVVNGNTVTFWKLLLCALVTVTFVIFLRLL